MRRSAARSLHESGVLQALRRDGDELVSEGRDDGRFNPALGAHEDDPAGRVQREPGFGNGHPREQVSAGPPADDGEFRAGDGLFWVHVR
jgi:hypothetical protein